MKLTPSRVRKVIEIAYVLEPILDKKDCTTRYRDLSGKPLTDFIIAGLNVAPIFEEYAESVINNGNKLMFSHYYKAVLNSNEYKKNKTINLGLLEMMFVFVRARLKYKTLKSVLSNVVKMIKDTTKKDVADNLKGFELAISTSTNQIKLKSAKNNHSYLINSESIYELFTKILRIFPDENLAGHQVANQYINGFPIVSRYINEIDEKKGLIKSIEDSFNNMHKENCKTKIGILADLSAVSIFLYLSFQKSDYIIR